MNLRFWRREAQTNSALPTTAPPATAGESALSGADSEETPRVARRRDWATLPPLQPTVAADQPMLTLRTEEFTASVSAAQNLLQRALPADAPLPPGGRVEGLVLVLPPPPPRPAEPAARDETSRGGRRMLHALPDTTSSDAEAPPPAPALRSALVVDTSASMADRPMPLTRATPVPTPPAPAPPAPPPWIDPPTAGPPRIAEPAPADRAFVGERAVEVVMPLHARRPRPAPPDSENRGRGGEGAGVAQLASAPAPTPAAAPIPPAPVAPAPPVTPTADPAPTTAPAVTPAVMPVAAIPTATPPATMPLGGGPDAPNAPPSRRRLGLGEPLTHIPVPQSPAAPAAARPGLVAPHAPGEVVVSPSPPTGPVEPSQSTPGETVQPLLLPHEGDTPPPRSVGPADESVGPRADEVDADFGPPPLVHRSDRSAEQQPLEGSARDGGAFDEASSDAGATPPERAAVEPAALHGVLGPPPDATLGAAPSTPWTTPPVRVQPVPAELRDALRQSHGLDPGDAQVVRGWAVDREADDRSARAFTRGAQVFLPEAAGPLHEEPARSLLAHELTHVAQQRGLGGTLPAEQSGPGRQLEEEAQSVENYFRRQPVTVGRPTPSLPAALTASPSPRAVAAVSRPPAGPGPVLGLPRPVTPAVARDAGWDTGSAAETQRVVQDLLSSGLATRGTAGELVFSRPQVPAMVGAVQHALEDGGLMIEAPPDLVLLPPPSLVLPPPTAPSPPAHSVASSVVAGSPAPPPAPPSAGPPSSAGEWAPPSMAPDAAVVEASSPGSVDAAAILDQARASSTPELDIDVIAARVGDLVQPTIGRQLRFELLRELRRELVTDRERKGRFTDG